MNEVKKIVLGADPFGFDIKEIIKKHLEELGYEVTDVGTLSKNEPVDYYNVGYNVGKAIADKKFEKGLVFCGSGMGVNIVANKFPGVYCGIVESIYTAQLCRTINNCNVLSLGGFLNGPVKACKMVDAFLNTEFAASGDEVDPTFLKNAYIKISEIEKDIFNEYANKL